MVFPVHHQSLRIAVLLPIRDMGDIDFQEITLQLLRGHLINNAHFTPESRQVEHRYLFRSFYKPTRNASNPERFGDV